MATALYRRYRPESFAEVIGQDHVTTPLRRALHASRIGHAYLFSGPRGCGKTTSARILARCLNCAEGPTDTPCDRCDSCRDLARGGAGSLDVVEIDAASHGGVDDARELRERASFAPVRDRFKVFIIDEAHMVTSAGFNALLKLVEEPPDHVKFIFATTEPDKVIGTIRSRTHHYPFRLIPPQVLGPYLDEVCVSEGVSVGEGVMALVVRAGGGSARDSMSVLDQLMAGAGDDGLDFSTAISLLGFTDTTLLDSAITAVAERDAGSLYGAVEHVLATGHEPRRFVEDLLERMRDLIVLAAVPERGADLLPQIPSDELDRMRTQATLFAPADISVCGDLVFETLATMSGATSPRLHLELLAARLVLRDERAALAAPAEGPAPGGRPASAPSGRGSQATSGQAQGGPAPGGQAPRGAQGEQAAPSGSGGREEARRIAQEKVEATRAARGGPAPSTGSQERGGWDVPVARPGEPAARPAGQNAPAASANTAAAGDGAGATDAGTRAEQQSGGMQNSGGRSEGDRAQRPAAQQTAPQSGPSTTSVSAAGDDLDAGTVRGHWSAILDELAQIRRPSWALISQNAHVNTVHGSTLVIGFRTEGLVSAFRRGTAAENLADAVRRIMHTDITVDVVVGEDPGPGGSGGGGGGGQPSPGGPGGQQGPSGAGGPSSPGGARGAGAQDGQRGASASGSGGGPGPGRPRSSAGDSGRPAAATGQDSSTAAWGDAVTAMVPREPAPQSAPATTEPAQSAAQSAPSPSAPRAQQVASAAQPSADQAPPARRGAPAAPADRVEDFAPEPDDPFPPDPEDSYPPEDAFPQHHPSASASSRGTPASAQGGASVPAQRGSGRNDRWSDSLAPAAAATPAAPAPQDAGAQAGPRTSSASQGSAADSASVPSASAPTEGHVTVGETPVVEDEGRDTVPADEPRTYGQNALRRAIAEGRVVRSRPAAGGARPSPDAPTGDEGAPGQGDGEGSPTSDGGQHPSGLSAVPAGASPSSMASASPATATAWADEPTASSGAAPADAAAPGPTPWGPPSAGSASEPSSRPGHEAPVGSASARAAASWGAAASVTSSTPAPAPSTPAPARSGAALAREAAQASRTAGLRTRGYAPEEPQAHVDPTGGASRDDENAVVANRNGREIIEKMLGGKILEVIDETENY